ncbi:MAG: DUF2877 domain-containing protein [Elusimicrobiota bacterium]|jgi:hypothetical protein
MSTPILVGDCVHPGRYALHSRFARAVNFSSHGRLVSLVTPAVGPGPLNIVLARLPEAAHRLEVDAHSVSVDGRALGASARYDSTLPKHRPDPAVLRRNLRACELHVRRNAPEIGLAGLLSEDPSAEPLRPFERALIERGRMGAVLLASGDWAAGARTLRGLGVGLTPSGDDFLAGWMLGLHLLKNLRLRPTRELRALRTAARGRGLLSGALLGCAARGRFFEPARTLVRTLLAGTPAGTRHATGTLLEHGASSGADLATGLLICMRARMGKDSIHAR